MDKTIPSFFGPLETTEEEMRTKIEQLNSIFTSKHCEMEVGTFRGMRIIRSPDGYKSGLTPDITPLLTTLQEDLKADKARFKQQEHKQLSKIALGPKRGRWA